jgi:hypothetical protein
MNDLCDVINYSGCLLFADDIKIFRVIKSPDDCNRLQSDIDSVQGWCIANFMELNISKTNVIYFSRKTNTLIYDYKLRQSSITRADSIKDLGVFIDFKLRFHNYVDYIFSQCIKLLGLVSTLTFSFSSLDCLYMLYFTLVRSKLEYASVVWNSIKTIDANKLERIQQKFTGPCYRFLPHVHYSYANALEYLNLHTFRKRRYHLDALFHIHVYRRLKYCPSLLEAVSLRLPTRYLRDSSVFNFSPSLKNCPSARCALAANVVCRDFDVFKTNIVSLSHIL